MKKIHFIFLLLLYLLIACNQKDCCVFPTGERVDMYLMDSYQQESNSQFNALRSYNLASQPVISYEDIVSYDDETYEMVLQAPSRTRVQAIRKAEPFALTVDQEIIYIGWFWPSFLSSSCNCINVDPIWAENGNTIRFRLGYGTGSDLSEIDRRNMDIILRTFDQDGKLK